MAKERVFRVVIDGEEYVSKAADEAGKGMDKFVGKKDGWFKSFVDLKAAWDVVAGAARALYGVATDSLQAFDQYDASMRKLEGTAKITGTPLSTLVDLAAHAKREFGLSSVQANDYATAVNNLATKAGYAGDKQELLAAMLDLGAAKGLTAAESLVAFEQSILGIDEGTDKLFGKNPSGLWADYADQIGKAPGQMNDLDKSLVLVYATMLAGGKVQGSFSEWLKSSAGQQELLNKRLEDAKVSFGSIISPIRAVVVEGINTFIDSLGTGGEALGQIKTALTLVAQNLVGAFLQAWQNIGPAVVFALKIAVAGVMLFTDGVRMMQIITGEVVGFVAQKLGGFAEKTATLMRRLGFDVTAEWGTTLRKWGEETDAKASASYDKFRAESSAAWAAVTKDAEDGAKESEGSHRDIAVAGEQSAARVTSASKASVADRTKEEKEYSAFVREEYRKNEAAIKVLNEAWKFKTQAVQLFEEAATKALSKDKLMPYKAGMSDITKASDEAFKSLLSHGDPLDQNLIKQGKINQAIDKAASILGTNARAVLDLAGAFGIADQEAQVLIGSAINLANAIPRALAGDFTAVGGALAAVGNMVKQISGGDAERKKLLQDNTRGLDRLRSEIGNLRLNVTGEMFTKVQGVLEKVVPGLRGGIQNFGTNMASIFEGLRGAGLSMADLEMVGKELGINLRDSKGNFSIDAVRQLLTAMGLTEFGQFGSGFSDQLDATTRSFGINGTDDMGQLSALFGVGGRFSPALANVFSAGDLQGSRARLQELFQGLIDGTIDPSQFGGLTGSQFLDFITDAIGRIDGILGADAPTPTGTAPLPGGEEVPVGTSPTPSPTLTLADVFREYRDASVPILTAQLDLQTRIAAATEATADHTMMTVEALSRIEQRLDGLSVTSLDESLGRQRAFDALAQGVPFTG